MTPINRDTDASSDESVMPKVLNPMIKHELRGGFNIGPHFEKLRHQYPQQTDAKIVSSVLIDP